MKKIGFVIPWYGESTPGGAEMELHQIATHLQQAGVELEVLTTCIKDRGAKWEENYYAVGRAVIDGVNVIRFPVRARESRAFERIKKSMQQGRKLSIQEELTYIEESVNSPRMMEYIEEHQEEYDLFVFIPFGYGTTYFGMQIAPEKSVLIPCFHDDALMRFRLFRQQYVEARGMIFNSVPEMDLANRLYDLSIPEQACMGIGVKTDISSDSYEFCKKYGIEKPFVLYAGRKDKNKNFQTLMTYYNEYCRRHDNPLCLVLIGDDEEQIPSESIPYVYDLGFVSDEDKYNAMAAATVLVQPSLQESFSSVIMESWLCDTPVLVHAGCPVTKEFVCNSNGGLYFQDFFEFEGCLNFLQENPACSRVMGHNGKKYVHSEFDWDVITKKYIAFFEKLTQE